MDWREPIAGLGGGLIVTIASWLLGRSDSAQERRDAEMRRVATEVFVSQKVDVRLTTIEVTLPRIEEKIDSAVELVKSTNETINYLARDGRLPIRRHDPQ